MIMKVQVTPGWDGLDDRLYRWVRVFGRIRDGETREQALAGLLPLFRSTLEADVKAPGFAGASSDARNSYLRNRLVLDPAAQGHSNFRSEMTKPLWVLMAIAGGVLVIACANVANVLLARAAGRQREIATRLSLGAPRSRLVQQLLVESLALSAVGGFVGVVLALGGAPLVLSFFVDPNGPPVMSTVPDLRILAFTFGLAVATGIVYGLAPAFSSTRADLAPTLKAESTSV